MTLLDDIQRWFAEGTHYGDGVRLLMRTGEHHTDVVFFTDYFRSHFVPSSVQRRLFATMKTYMAKLKSMPEMMENQAFVGNPVIIASRVAEMLPKVAPTEPVEIQKLRETAKEWHKKQSYIHAQMGMVSSDEERYGCATELMEEIIPTLDQIYDQIRAYEKDGTLPAPAAVDDIARQAIKDYMRMEKTLRPRISRLKKWIANGINDKKRKLSDLEIEKYKKELIEKELEFQNIKNRLGI